MLDGSAELFLYERSLDENLGMQFTQPTQLAGARGGFGNQTARRWRTQGKRGPRNPWGASDEAFYGHHVGPYDPETSQLEPITPVDAAAKRHDEEYGVIQERYEVPGSNMYEVWFMNYLWPDPMMHLEFAASDVALVGRAWLGILEGVFSTGEYDLTFTHGTQGWVNLFSDLLIATGITVYGLGSAWLHLAYLYYMPALWVPFQLRKWYLQNESAIQGGLQYYGHKVSGGWKYYGGKASEEAKDLGGRISGGAKYYGGKVSGGAKYYGGKVSGGAKYYGGQISGGAKHIGGQISGGAKHIGGQISGGAKHIGGQFSSGLKSLSARSEKGVGTGARLEKGARSVGRKLDPSSW